MKRIVLFTIVEALTLAVWLALALKGFPFIQAVGVLFTGLLIEHIFNVNTVLKQNLFNLDRLLGIVGFTITETITWIVWLLVALEAPIVAAIILALGLLIEHNQTDNVIHEKPFFSRLLSIGNLGHTLVEVVGGSVWLALVLMGQNVLGAGILAVALFIHHTIAVRRGQKELAK